MSAKSYVGLANTFHDSAMAIVDSRGEIVFAEATERYLQNKRAINCVPDFYHWTSSVIDRYVEKDSEIVVAHSWSEKAVTIMSGILQEVRDDEKRVRQLFGEVPDFMKSHLSSREFYATSLSNLSAQTSKTLLYELSQNGRQQSFGDLVPRRYDHHLTHAATACYSSPFEEGLCAVIDGLGEGSSTCCYRFKGRQLEKITDVPNSSTGSLGLFYTLVCVTCGFGHLTGEEWKVMGLAAYGKHDPEIYELLRSLIHVDGLEIKFPSGAAMIPVLKQLHEHRRREDQPPVAAVDIAHAGQRVFTEVYFEFLRNLREYGGSDNLVISGGCGLNSAANGRIKSETGFENVFVFSAPGDDGNAIGAALLAYHEDNPEASSSTTLQLPYLGSTMSEDTLDKMGSFGPAGQNTLEDHELFSRCARALADGKIIGWVQGRAEFGPRALGNRSILADARYPDMKDRINARIKFRESFRPFAPSILHDHGAEYFYDYQDAPYMERTLLFREEVRSRVPAVVHKDGTGRLHTVREEWNERYYRLIREFYRVTGVPLILNTSFNVMGKPIIHTVEDALAVFYTSGLDVLVIGNVFIEKEVVH